MTNFDADANLALRVQRLESLYETSRAAILDAFRQIDELKHRIDRHYTRIHQLEEAVEVCDRHKQKGLKNQAMHALHCIMSGANDTREQYLDFLLIKEALKRLSSDEES